MGVQWDCTSATCILKIYYSFRREIFYKNLTEFCIPMKLIGLIIMCCNGTYSTVRIGEHLSSAFLIQDDLKQGEALSPLLLKFVLKYAIRKVRKRGVGIE
jgi:hypothetical protein